MVSSVSVRESCTGVKVMSAVPVLSPAVIVIDPGGLGDVL